MTDIATKLDEVLTAVKATQDKHDQYAKGRDELDAQTAKKSAEAAAAAMQEIQDTKAAIKANEDMIKNLEASLLKAGNGSGSRDQELDKKWGKSITQYLRKNKAPSDDLVRSVCEEYAEKHLFCADDDQAMQIKTLQELNNPDGGYFLRPQYSQTMIKRIFETSPVRQVASIETTNTNALEFVIDDDTGVSGGWVGELQTRSDTNTPQVGLLTIATHEQYAQPNSSQKMLDDAGFNIEGWLADKTTDIFTRTENTAFVSGSGVTQPKGFLSYDAWSVNGAYQRNAIEQIASGSATDFTGDGIKALQNSLIEFYQPNAKFMLKRASFENIITLKDGQGRYLLNTESLKQGDTKVLLGKEVIFANDIPAVAGAALAMVYGDFKMGYTIVDRIGIRVLRDPYTSKPLIKFYTTKRVGGGVTNFEALKIQKISV